MPKIYYPFCAVPTTGGDFVNLEHVKTLRKFGLDARIIYLEDVEGDTAAIDAAFHHFPVSYSCREATALDPDDIFVISECQPGLIQQACEPNSLLCCRLVMHNQNPFYSYHGFRSGQAINAHPIEQILVPSAYTARRLRETGVTKPMQVIHPYIPDYFAPKAKSLNPIKIAYSSRKRSAEVDIVKFYFCSHYALDTDVQFVNILGVSREQVAEIMAESAIFLSFAERESLGLMALEAMASGCHMIGFSGYSGGYSEFFTSTTGDWVAEGDYLTFAQYIVRAIAEMVDTQNPLTLKAKAGLATVENHFRQANFEAELKTAFENLLGEPIAR